MTADQGAFETSTAARIVDRGYQHYDGPRLGVASSMRAIAVGTMRRSLGFKRSTGAKILPILLIVVAFLPGTAVTVIRVLVGPSFFRRGVDQVLPFPGYFGLLSTVIVLLAALAASEALCPDRRQRVLSLYYASPVSPPLYLLAQMAAVATVLLLVTLAPPLLLWLANVGLADDPWPYLQDHLDQFLRILGAGTAVALFNAALALAVSSLTDRKAYAAGALLGSTVALRATGGVIRALVHGGWAKYTGLIDPFNLPLNVARWLLSDKTNPNLPGALYLAALLAVTAASLLVLRRVYRAIVF